MEKENIKNFIFLAIIIILVISVLIIGVSVYSSTKKKKLEKEKAERAAKVKANELLGLFSKIEWKEILEENCHAENKDIRANRFSWINTAGGAELMDGYNLNIIFTNTKNGVCCGKIEKVQEKIKMFFAQNEFKENQINLNKENYIYALENDGMKCIYGFKNVENQETFCELGIICGRVNNVFTASYFQQIYNIFNNDKDHNMVVVDKLVENLDGKFAKGRIGYTFYLNADKVFIAKQGEDGNWGSLDKPEKEDRKIEKCEYLLGWKVPPQIVGDTCKNRKGETIDYLKLYSENK